MSQNYPNNNDKQNNYRQYDTAYRENYNNNNIPISNLGDQIYYRKPGFDAGTILWPALAILVYLISTYAVTIGVVFFSMIANTNLYSEFITSSDVQIIMDLVMGNYYLITIISSVITLFVLWLLLRWRNRREIDYVLKDRLKISNTVGIVVLALGTLALSQLWMVLVDFLAQHIPYFARAIESYSVVTVTIESDNLILMTIVLAIIVPIVEELLFRGVLLSELRRVMPGWLAATLIGVFFGLFHGNLVQGVYAAIAGVVMGLVYVWTNSIWAPILFHMVYNFFGGVVPTMIEKYGWLENADNSVAVILLLVVFALLVLGAIALISMYRNRGGERKPQPVVREEFRGFIET